MKHDLTPVEHAILENHSAGRTVFHGLAFRPRVKYRDALTAHINLKDRGLIALIGVAFIVTASGRSALAGYQGKV